MSFDGSFRVDYELQRFLSRCPELASISQFDYLLKKGDKVTEEEVVNALGQLMIHPKYTIPLVGCFRPLARKIVDRAISLLRLVPNLRCNDDGDLMEVDQEDDCREVEGLDIEDTIGIIDVYAKRGKGLKLHELACLAFCRAHDLVPSLLRSVLGYFEFAPPPFEGIRQRKSDTEAVVLDGAGLLNVVRVSYRLLLADPEDFAMRWNWSCFFDIISLGKNEEPNRSAFDLRWYGIKILSIVFKLNDQAIANFNCCSQEAYCCSLSWKEYCQDGALEKAGWYLESSHENNQDLAGGSMGLNRCHSLQSSPFDSLVLSSSTIQEKGDRKLTWECGKPFILTSAMRKSYEMVFLAFSQRWPVLLYGPAGAGKTALISKLAELNGDRVLFLHMDEQVDGKMLVGTYVCTEQPGEFRWQPGSLTQAVSNGFWVVFEDVDKAPPDVQCILLPLLEGATSFFTGHGEAIRVHEGFRLFSTMTSTKIDISMEGRSSVSALWRRVMIAPSSHQDLLKIVNKWYPELESLAAELIGTFDRVNELVGSHFGTGAYLGFLGRFSLRDLLKWCKRIAGLGVHFGGDGLSAYENIYKEAVDIFASFSTSHEKRLAIVKEIAKMWSAGPVDTLYPIDRPVIQELASDLRIGRVVLKRNHRATWEEKKHFVEIRNLIHVLERIACSVKYNEPVLLVGETGTGKTTLVQSLASRLGQKLTVLNLSQQSDVTDLLGGFKPMDAQFICIPLYKEFENLFTTTFSSKENEVFLVRLRKFVSEKNWKMLLGGFQKGVGKIIEIGRSGSGAKRKRPLEDKLIKAWEAFSLKLDKARMQISASGGMIFSFVEGAFISALKNGEWILLDEVNLAPPETLQRVIGVLEEETGSLCLTERGDVDYVSRHSNFRLFACMNPATDAGKRDLPISLRSRFTEYFVDDLLDDKDLSLFISQFIDGDHSNRELVNKIVQFYKAAKKQSEEKLQDGANQKPQYSLRSLYRALEYTKKAKRTFGLPKALYDGFCMFFLISLDEPSAKIMNQLITKYLLEGKIPPQISFDAYLLDRGNSRSDDLVESYVLTKSVKEHIRNLARAIFVGRYPVLLQGPTSSGKTSLVQYLAAITGHEFVRINNHEHTDLQEYLGSYVTDANGKLVFHEGALVKAVRNGHWIVLDELNLAPSDVLEALNRLLDDNRELFVPELCETVRAHPNFMLFATQNPPTLYGGRKMLSRAFRNRFVEIHVDEIPEDELSTILTNRCEIPESYARKMVVVMKELQLHRQSTKIFAGKHGFITPRDLFRWANRLREFGKSYEDLAFDGYYLMAERLRNNDEKKVVQAVVEQQLRVRLAEDDMYKQGGGGDKALEVDKHSGVTGKLGKIVWTRSMRRLYFLVERCYKLREPVLLVGETGGGKTSVCQLLSIILGSKLHILNCHQYTETSDFLGGFYPVRERSRISTEFKHLCEKLMHSKAFVNYPGDSMISSDINQASTTLHKLSVILSSYRQCLIRHPDVTGQDVDYIGQLNLDLVQLHQKWQTIFMWQDGPLVEAMKKGELFLVDEISLADDSVLERLNSVLEPERKLSLAEKGGSDLQKITAHPDFFLLATMNPGGDFGKKELSPALRNRFTEIWVPPITELDELKSIALESISNANFSVLVDLMMKFWEWFNNLQTGRALTVRDLLSWVSFINVTESTLQPESAFLHGAFLVLLDGLSLGTNISRIDAAGLRENCLSFLLEGLKELNISFDCSNISMLMSYGWTDPARSAVIACTDTMQCDNRFGIPPFSIEKGGNCFAGEKFELLAPTTRRNAFRVLRAMQLAKPVLLEGSPGVGKTSLIVALGKFSGHTVVRINLSEQTDIMDLFGSDLPVEADEGMQFAWSDGILLQALKQGSWVLLDELNLASQSVLEGLNAILDHRAEVFIPELGRTFKCPPSFRVFACQNPSNQGGGRKGLPKSFLNRFMKVYVDELVEDDYLAISSSLYPTISRSLLSKLVLFNKRLHEEIMLLHKFAQEGSPWEFNLRDVIRSCEIIKGAPSISKSDCFLNPVYVQRMRTAVDRLEVLKLYEQVFKMKPSINPHPRVQLNPQYLIVGNVSIERNRYVSPGVANNELKILPGFRNCLEAVAQCVKNQWLCILVGPASSGKTSLIRLLAQLTGNVLNELNLSSATDISELLGSFEQHNAVRKYRLAIARVESVINEYYGLQLESSCEEFMRRKELFILWLSFVSSIKHNPPASSCSSYVDTWRTKYFESASTLVNIIEHLKLVVEETSLPLSWSMKDLDIILTMINKFTGHPWIHSSKFEWVTGMLIKAIENGEWIVLDNANLCNPTVLDRINSLVEQSGSITINECGTVEGKPVILHPHPQFRMFLTVNPLNGEVSRAMRNRGVEIFMMEPDWLFDDKCTEIDIELENARRFIVLSGVPACKLVDLMANAHMTAKVKGALLKIRITLLELARWVQLFQQLLTSGSQFSWSLQTSWEHTYVSLFGVDQGKNVVDQVGIPISLIPDFQDFNSSQAGFLSLPGGWPAPLKLRDYVLYSKETCIRQNCMYLEFLGAQTACYSTSAVLHRALAPTSVVSSLVMDTKLLHALMFPKGSSCQVAVCGWAKELNLDLAQEMLLYAANWAFEQATESDYKLYLLWFSHVGSLLRPHSSFFSFYASILAKELEHPIWNQIFSHRREIVSHNLVDMESCPIPLLSVEVVDLTPADGVLKSCSEVLVNAIKSVRLLRLSHLQWNFEIGYKYSPETKFFKPVLRSLQELENKVLEMFVQSPSFDVLFQLYSDLLEHHTLLWTGIITSQLEYLLISWRSLMKKVTKLWEFCPKEVETFQRDVENLDEFSKWPSQSQKSLLWVHGGHPYLPPSAELYEKLCQLLSFCERLWPGKRKIWELARDDVIIEVAPYSNPELRFLAMQGVSMSSYIMAKVDENSVRPVEQLEEMYQMLSRRFDFEKEKLEANLRNIKQAPRTSILPACCVFLSDMLCERSSFGCWLETLPIVDNASFFHDTRLLQQLSTIASADEEEQYQGLTAMAGLIESAMTFSLNFSSRPSSDFSPHQKILWTLDAWDSIYRVSEQISSFVLELWYIWHSSLWMLSPAGAENLSWHGCDDILPDELFKPSKMAAIHRILYGTFAIRDYPMHSLKMKAASRYLWQGSLEVDTKNFLLSTARSLFQQMIFAHRKSFEAEKFGRIKAFFHFATLKTISQEDVQVMLSLLASSNHQMISSDKMKSFIEPLLRGLYLPCSSEGFMNRIGCVWLLIGALRYQLLICCTDLDPTAKHCLKYSRVMEKISSLQLETRVRSDCVHLAGSFQLREQDRDRSLLLEDLHAEQKKLQRKIVFRSEPEKFKEMKAGCDDFFKTVVKIVMTTVGWTQNFKNLNVEEMSGEIRNWQEMATDIIKRLSNEYSAYMDVVQPVQTAIYEMKLGLSLVLSGALSEKYLEELGKFDMESVLASVYAFVRFPRGCAAKAVSFNAYNKCTELLRYDIELPTNISAMDLDMLDNLVNYQRKVSIDSKVSSLQLRTAMHQTVLVRVLHSVVDAHFMDKQSFKLTNKIFDELATIWMQMKLQVRTTEENKTQQFRFKPRAFKIDNILEIDISSLGSSASNESFLEWKEFHSSQESSEKTADEESEAGMDDWNYVEESSLNDMIRVHNELFGSTDIYQSPGCFHVSDASRLSSFTDSYSLGTKMIREIEGLSSSCLDAKIAPEHLLRLCLEHETKFCSPNKSALAYNFYKEPNFSMLAKMVDPLASLKQRITLLLKERDEYALQRILDIIEMILAMPLSTPLAKALSSIEFLLSRVRMLQETVAKFPLSDHLDPIFALVSSWYKLEFESWPALLDEVEDQFEKNAGKLWFPLYSVLRREQCGETDEYNLSTIRSLKEFTEMSSIGEFKKRLQLLLAFHGHISTGLRNGTYSSLHLEETIKILYNTFGFYAQFLPKILEHIGTKRRKIEEEVNELVKLCRWERLEDYLSIESSRRTRQKLRKIMQKYTDLLQQPVMLFINREATESGIHPQSNDPSLLVDSFERSRGLLNIVFDQKQSEVDSPSWFSDWWKKVENVVQGLHLDVSRDTELSRIIEEVAGVIKDGQCFKSSCLLYLDEWKQLRQTIDKICRTIIDCVDVWEDASKKMGKRRVFSDLLKLLDSCGLSKHRALFMEEQWKVNILMCWFLQPSYDVQHLLLTQGLPASKDSEVSSRQLQSLLDESLETKWKTANLYYFKSINSVHVLQQICLSFHKDFTLEQVNKSGSYIDHLTSIQQEQREVAYAFSQRLKCLKELLLTLATLTTGDIPFTNVRSDRSFAKNQYSIYECLWQQKQLFDNLYGMLYEERLFVETVEDIHLNTCSSVKDSTMQIRLFIEKHLPIVKESKDLLDGHLIGFHGVRKTEENALHPIAITKHMEQLVYKNFDLVKEFEVDYRAFHRRDGAGAAVKDILLGHFEEIFDKTNFIHNQFKARNTFEDRAQDSIQNKGDITRLQAEFYNTLENTYRAIMNTLNGLVPLTNGCVPPDEENINAWKILLESATRHLQSDLSDQIVKTIHLGGELLNYYSTGNASSYSVVRAHIENLYSLLDVIIAFGDGLLYDFLIMHRMLSVMTHVLANVFTSLFAKGFGTKEEDTNDASQDLVQDQSGTGMGEGSGMKDVSDQINDEDQLIGTSADRDEESTLGEAPSKTDKGIEMEQDFAADTFSVSEDSADDEEGNEENEELESAMGETGDRGEVADEKQWDKGDDNPSTMDEKYESGPSVKDSGINRELRAKDDADEAGELNPDISEEQADENGNDETCEGMEDINMDKEDAYADPTGLKPDEHDQGPEEDCNMDEPESAEPMVEDDLNQQGDPAEEKNEEGETANSDATFDEADPEHLDENPGGADEEGDHADDTKKEPAAQNREILQSDTSHSVGDNVPTAVSASEPRGEYNQANLKDAPPEAKGSDVGGPQHDLAPMRGLPDASMVEIMASDSSNGQKLGSDPPENPLPPADSSHQRIQPNPCRSVGDALEGWKDRVKVSPDLQESEAPDDMAAENANEYSYTAEFEKGTAQALGPATADQVDKNVHGNDLEGENATTERKDDISGMEIERQLYEAHTVSNSALSFCNDKGKQSEIMDTEEQPESPSEVDARDDTGVTSSSQSLVSVKRTFLVEDINRLSELSVDDDDLGKARNLEDVSDEMRKNAATLWKDYELRTTRLSQELAEQLRLVMEPTLASKLQGDYKTGKRINMKKVIPYIASHYRKDKIWLRRTRPNKRNYQVVIAVDDSRSMSERGCGHLAIEALVTVCRAMSQLEIGQLSVASFGKKGNIRILHDFDQSFTGEAGIKMISSLSFKQENTIAEEPMVDLLKYLNDMLDAAAVNARLPSGHNPLEQLVLIIADGWFHEKENMKRYVRDLLSKKRMVAFLVVDSLQKSILDLEEATFQGGEVKLTKYLDSFPFPYYVVLKNIEALPRTLADLLRQWFELMQQSRE